MANVFNLAEQQADVDVDSIDAVDAADAADTVEASGLQDGLGHGAAGGQEEGFSGSFFSNEPERRSKSKARELLLRLGAYPLAETMLVFGSGFTTFGLVESVRVMEATIILVLSVAKANRAFAELP